MNHARANLARRRMLGPADVQTAQRPLENATPLRRMRGGGACDSRPVSEPRGPKPRWPALVVRAMQVLGEAG